MAQQKQLIHCQHIVPQWHLRQFTDANGSLWVYKQNAPVKERRPKGECWERDFYEYSVKGRRTSNSYENWLGRIENDASRLVDKLLGRLAQIMPSDAVVWASYVASLFLRTQKIRDQKSAAMIEGTQAPDFIRNIQYEILRHGQLVFAEDVRNRVEALRTSLEGPSAYYHLIGLEETTAALGDALMRKSWHLLQAPKGKFFVLSDCPVTTVELAPGQQKPGVGFGHALAAIILPVTPQHAFVAAPALSQWKPVVSPRVVDSINRLTVWFARKKVYAHAKSAEIEALVNEEINQIVFGRDAFLPSSQN
jgi:hypothetical protein